MSADKIDHIRDLFRAGKVILPPHRMPEPEPPPLSAPADAALYGLLAALSLNLEDLGGAS